jgi:hypothetical protein
MFGGHGISTGDLTLELLADLGLGRRYGSRPARIPAPYLKPQDVNV